MYAMAACQVSRRSEISCAVHWSRPLGPCCCRAAVVVSAAAAIHAASAALASSADAAGAAAKAEIEAIVRAYQYSVLAALVVDVELVVLGVGE